MTKRYVMRRESVERDKQVIKCYMEAYKTGRSQAWVAEQMGVTKKTISARVCKIRSRGVALPALINSNMETYPVNELNAIVKESKEGAEYGKRSN